MFDAEASVAAFLDRGLERFRERPEGDVPSARYHSFPSRALEEAANLDILPEKPAHAEGERCLATPGDPEGTLRLEIVGRALGSERKATGQESYVEELVTIDVPLQEELARAAAAAGEKRFQAPAPFARALAGQAYLGMLDVDPRRGAGGTAELMLARTAEGLYRLEGRSEFSGGDARWSHAVKLEWSGWIRIRDGRVAELAAQAEGTEKLRWGGGGGGPDVAHLPAGRAIDFDGKVRYGIVGRPVRGAEVGPGPAPAAGGPPASLQRKMQALQAAIRARGGPGSAGPSLRRFEGHLRAGRFADAEAALDDALRALQD